MRQAGVVAAGPSKELEAQAVVYVPILRDGSQGRVTHGPQAGVLTVQRDGQKNTLLILLGYFRGVIHADIRYRLLDQCLHKIKFFGQS